MLDICSLQEFHFFAVECLYYSESYTYLQMFISLTNFRVLQQFHILVFVIFFFVNFSFVVGVGRQY